MQLSTPSCDSWVILISAGKVGLVQEGRGSVPITEGLELSARTHKDTETSTEEHSDWRKTSLCENKFMTGSKLIFDTIKLIMIVQSCTRCSHAIL